MIGGRGGKEDILRILGPPAVKPDEELSPEALLLRKLRRALPVDDRRRPATVLRGQRAFDGQEVGE
jgi:hypothetical protein